MAGNRTATGRYVEICVAISLSSTRRCDISLIYLPVILSGSEVAMPDFCFAQEAVIAMSMLLISSCCWAPGSLHYLR